MNPIQLATAVRVLDSVYRIAYTSLMLYALFHAAKRGDAQRTLRPRVLH